MRKIIPDPAQYNAALPVASRFWGLVLILGLALAIGACSPDGKTSEKAGAGGTADDEDCPVRIDISAWTAFRELTERIHTGNPVPQEEILAFANLPTVALWRESLHPKSPSAEKMTIWFEGAFWTELGRQGEQKAEGASSDLGRSYVYSFKNRDRIDQRLAGFAGPSRCRLDSLARYWIDPDKLPNPVTLHFLPALAEIRISGGSLFVDTGVVAAIYPSQLTQRMASLLYRNYGTLPGGNPTELEGEEAIAASFLVFLNEGITGWIGKTADLEFDPSHPRLSKVKLFPETFFLKAQEILDVLNSNLGPILAYESEISARGAGFARNLAGRNAFGMTGYAMAAVIAGQLGEDRLKEVRHSVPAFLAAFQEAALRNPNPAPVPGSLGVDLFETVPPLEPDIYAKLHTLLVKAFPE